VLYATGSSARQTKVTQNLPVDGVVMAIIDTLEVDGQLTYDKAGESG
jgi:microcompartment protein CcmK/EutM